MSLGSDSDSELSPSDSGEEEDEDQFEEEQKEDMKNMRNSQTPNKKLSAALYKTPAKRTRTTAAPLSQPTMTEEYFEAHGSSKVLTSDRTLERLHTPKLDRVCKVQPVVHTS